MRAGRLRHYVELQKPTNPGTRDSVGERTTVWTPVASVYADIIPLSATTIMAARQANSAVTHRIRIRAGSEIASIDGSWRIVYGSRVFVVEGVVDVNERRREIELTCIEGLRTE